MTWTLEVRDASLERIHEVTRFSKFSTVLRFNNLSTWELDLPATTAAASALLERGAGIIATRDGETMLSGLVTRRHRVRNKEENRISISGIDDTVWTGRRLAPPVPDGPPYDTDGHDVRTGPAETVMHEFVDVNAGPGAITARRAPGLTLAPDLGRGSVVTGRARFHVLLELLQSLALAGGDLGFRIVQVDDELQFQVYEPTDLSASVVFSLELGNLSGYEQLAEDPEANYYVGAGAGELVDRIFVERGDPASIVNYGRIEAFRDRRDTADTAEITQTLDEELAQNAERMSLSINPSNTRAVAFMDDYRLGDRVSAVIDGEEIIDVIREVAIDLDSKGETVTPTIGSPNLEPNAIFRMFKRIGKAESRIGSLERR